jgi:histidinol-phosphatase (PHP family)
MWTNYHCHSDFCDGKGPLKDYITAARKQGLFSFGFSSHAPLPFQTGWSMKAGKLQQYVAEIEDLRGCEPSLEIYKGLEVDFIPGIISPHQYKDELDYTIGSIHFVDSFNNGKRWEIDNLYSIFLEGLEKIFKGNVKDAIVRYFELTKEMLYSSTPDIIGHLDKIKIQNKEKTLFNENEQWYKDAILEILQLVEQAGVIVEVNTRGIYQKKSATTYPSPWILEEIFKRQIPITISSDSHTPDDITNQFPETAKLLYDIGFRTLSVLKEGKWQQASFDQHGISQK